LEHKKGAFTDAKRRIAPVGLSKRNKDTLFLDEIWKLNPCTSPSSQLLALCKIRESDIESELNSTLWEVQYQIDLCDQYAAFNNNGL